MKRRDFLLKSAITGGFAMVPSFTGKLFGSLRPNPDYDLVAIKGGEPDAMFEKAIQALGGMKKFVKKGQSVVVKPNIGWDLPPERAANTNPLLVKKVVEHCYQAGAKVVYVFDNTCNNWRKCYVNSSIEKMVKDVGGKTVPAHTDSYYQSVKIDQGKRLTTAKVHELILESDVFINIPVLKHHSSADLTIAMKNLMGVVWDRRYWHRNDLHQCIADYASFYKKPDLNIVDAYRIMYQNGPRGVDLSDVKTMKAQLISTDMVAVDAAAAKMMGKSPDDISYIKIAHNMKVGNMHLEKLNIARLSA